ncbi:LINE-1 retrotransposable element ORF2 protein [Holothuria leucospilota]|uniref:LINE-1 retrotransposable element ORF2 protein n=1 Tax=Holothuria leucospilota TaxID=206669 RepID=A0A9Q1CKP6_HOLLE|nr:LINE-1 retrotransposable element ORF2 protein [Holothuria leucospilota]
MKILNAFSAASGLKVNFEKSFRFPLGGFANTPPHYFSDFSFPVSLGPVKYLGISLSHHEDDFFRLNVLPKISRLKRLLNQWSSRDLTPLGKITVIKAFAISQLLFLFTVLNNPPPDFLAQVNECLFNFLWNSKIDKIKPTTVINAIGSGGLNMVDLLSFMKSLNAAAWVKRYIDGRDFQ